MINFFRGHPTANLLPADAILQATTSLLTRPRPEDSNEEDRHPMTYGSDPGSSKVRQELADWTLKSFKEIKFGETLEKNNKSNDGASIPLVISKTRENTKEQYNFTIKNYRESINKDSINLTNGASFGAMNALLQLTLPHTNLTKHAFIVSPTYFLINSVFLDAGFAGKMTAIKQDAGTGELDFDKLEELLIHYSSDPTTTESSQPDHNNAIYDETRPTDRKIYKFVIYLVPTFSNPTGCTMSLEDRLRLIQLARKYDMLILCDDVYDLLDFRKQTAETGAASNSNAVLPPRIVTLDRWTLGENETVGNTISNLTFSKLLGPGLRVGWQESVSPYLASKQLAAGGAIRSGGTPSHFTSTVVGELLSLGLSESIISNLNVIYGQRCKKLIETAHKELPEGTKVYGGQGGYFVWIELPMTEQYKRLGLTAQIIAKACKKYESVVLAPGNEFEVTSTENQNNCMNWGMNCFRLSVSYLSESQIEQGIIKFGRVLKKVLNEEISIENI